MYTASTAFLEALNEAGVEYIFANLGSDHPGLIEAMAEARHHGRPVPALVTCPNEFVGLSAAHGYAQVSGKPQAVVVHVECGTQSLAGAIHNAAKGRVPVLIFAGASPYTQDGELRGSRNEFIQWIQDVFDQRGIVRGYMKYDNELRSGRNVKQIVHRALQFANSDPKGPVYLMGAREVMEEEIEPQRAAAGDWQPVAPLPLPQEGAEALLDELLKAKRPLLVTSYVGRNPAAVEELARLCRRTGMGVIESVPSWFNFPTTDPLYLGNVWNQQQRNPILAAADFILVIDSDVPWIPSVNRPSPEAVIHHIDVDPLKQQMPLWHIPARRVFRADALTALRQLNAALDARAIDGAAVTERARHYAGLHEERRRALSRLETGNMGVVTPHYLSACVRRYVDDDTIVLNEGITNYGVIIDHLRLTRPGSMVGSGGGSLGWNGGAAIGAKLACPDRTVIAMTGDGSYMFSQPSTVHWMARQYKTPFLHVVLNNRGWRAPRFSALAVHPKGYASRSNDIGVSFDPPPDYAGIAAAAGGAFARTVKEAAELEPALADAMQAVRKEKRAAVLDVWLPHL